MIRCSRIKISRAPAQETRLLVALDLCRQLYNAALQQRIEAWERQRKSLSRYDQQKDLTELRADDPVYAALPAVMTRETAFARLDLAFKAFFRRCKSGETPGFPRFRSRDRFDTLVFGTESWKLKNGGRKLVLNIGGEPITLRLGQAPHREGKIKGLRLTRSADRWYANFVIDVGEAPAPKPSTNGVGIDVGLRTFATMSNGTTVAHPRFLRKSMADLTIKQQAVSACKRGSNRRRKVKLALAKTHERVANRRRDFVYQTCASLVALYDGFSVEKLDVQEMVDADRSAPDGMGKAQARGMRRGIMDSGWSMFVAHLAGKAEEAGLPFVRVNPKGTSQGCSGCGSLVRKGLRVRVHECHACGLVLDRDVNAATNIFDRGRRALALDDGGGDDPGRGSATVKTGVEVPEGGTVLEADLTGLSSFG